ncbi:hypothetical protein Krad_2148 [Kineococcus radiotolerans SRS30216 = ATCC BAA-149]|uniref:DUF1524 domain-containing protein n=1 Tax=Kineococcus radiotolerans (strain ATCC BAA-149 / DSM 14245 / SRS30216) TaxID=266940 RepID=A6W9Z3_KINRD|nr:hypothetical protein Krad_2148 [Kineococcus radiotolerans SRS30216 = ATCC BAA-149]
MDFTASTAASSLRHAQGEPHLATTSSAVQIDHVVALSQAWQRGAEQWDEVIGSPSPTRAWNCRRGQAAERAAGRRRPHLAAADPGVPLHPRRPPGRAEGHLGGVGVTSAERTPSRVLGVVPGRGRGGTTPSTPSTATGTATARSARRHLSTRVTIGCGGSW